MTSKQFEVPEEDESRLSKDECHASGYCGEGLNVTLNPEKLKCSKRKPRIASYPKVIPRESREPEYLGMTVTSPIFSCSF